MPIQPEHQDSFLAQPQVIVAGMPRTGTESLKKALEIIYGNHSRAYHMSEVLNRPRHLDVWADLAFGRRSPEQIQWADFLKGYIATTDMPCALYFQELSAAFPDAKIILSLRDESTWFESYYRLLVSAHQFRFLRFLPPLNRFWPYGVKLHEILFGDAFAEQGPVRELVIAGYRRHNQRVRESIVPERLLEYSVEEGWEPLCEFLGVQQPQVSFPYLNAGVAGPRRIIAQAVKKITLQRLLGIGGLLLGCLLFFLWWAKA